MERGSGRTKEQLQDAMLRVSERQDIVFVCPTRNAVDYTIRLFRFMLNENNPSYAISVSPCVYTIPHMHARITFVSPENDPLKWQASRNLKIVLDHAIDELYFAGNNDVRKWIRFTEEMKQWQRMKKSRH